MKRILLVTFCMLIVGGTVARATDARAAERQTRRAVVQSFSEGMPAAAIAALHAQLKPDEGPEGATSALVRQLIAISCTLNNRGQRAAAREAAMQALEAVTPLMNTQGAAVEKRRKDLQGSLAVLCEEVLRDLDLAQAYYTAAANSPLAVDGDVQRLEAVKRKIELRNTRAKK